MKKDAPLLYIYMQKKFPRLNEAKIKEGDFADPQTRRFVRNTSDSILNEAELSAWAAFENVCSNFLENTKADNYQEIVDSSSHMKQWGATCR
jgi:hypothetical protein